MGCGRRRRVSIGKLPGPGARPVFVRRKARYNEIEERSVETRKEYLNEIEEPGALRLDQEEGESSKHFF